MFVARLQFVFIVHFIVSFFLVQARPLSVSFLIRTSEKAKLLLVVVRATRCKGKHSVAVVTPAVQTPESLPGSPLKTTIKEGGY